MAFIKPVFAPHSMSNPPSDLESWTEFLTQREIPVLRHTVRALSEAREQADSISVRKLASIILMDPLMTVRVLRFSNERRSRRRLQEISTVEHALMMLGVEPFFHHFSQLGAVEDVLKPYPQALLGLLHVIRRAQRAGRYAFDWATWRCDLNSEEVGIAALLHDLAEIMVWCFSPHQALQIEAMRKAHPTTRSAEIQQAVLGFPSADLQVALCQRWHLSELLLNLMDDRHADKPRVKNVKLAVDLARHSANGWDDPALPDDFRAIASLMNIDDATLRLRLGLEPADADGADPAATQTPKR